MRKNCASAGFRKCAIFGSKSFRKYVFYAMNQFYTIRNNCVRYKVDCMKKGHNLSKPDVIEQIPLACSDELTAVEFLEKQRWGNSPRCVLCGNVGVCAMKDRKTGGRSKRFLWYCRDCKQQYTVRIGTIYEESRIDLRHWCYAFWRAATSKNGVSALEIKRHCQISYKSALLLMNRIQTAQS